jgi:hypothetical protein
LAGPGRAITMVGVRMRRMADGSPGVCASERPKPARNLLLLLLLLLPRPHAP